MEQERIPFNIKFRPDIEAGKYLVVTRDGREVEIIRWDWPDENYPIRAHIKGMGCDYTYTNRGEFDKGRPDDIDLFLVPNPDYKEPTTTCSTSVDWDAFRREAALQIAAGFAANGNFLERSIGNLSEDIAEDAVVTADILIKQLKEGKK